MVVKQAMTCMAGYYGDSCHPLELLPSTNGSIQGGDGDMKIGADMIVSLSESRMRLFAVGGRLG